MIIKTNYVAPDTGQAVFSSALLDAYAPIEPSAWWVFGDDSSSLTDLSGNAVTLADAATTKTYGAKVVGGAYPDTGLSIGANTTGSNEFQSDKGIPSAGFSFAVTFQKVASAAASVFGVGVHSTAFHFYVDNNANRPRFIFAEGTSQVIQATTTVTATTELVVMGSCDLDGVNATFTMLFPQSSATAVTDSTTTLEATYASHNFDIGAPFGAAYTQPLVIYEAVIYDRVMTATQLAAEYVLLKGRMTARGLTLLDA
tara:strand:+ start:1162 stop:1929 length:768 start_codon:yes stop_codon:yes gene_type:complete